MDNVTQVLELGRPLLPLASSVLWIGRLLTRQKHAENVAMMGRAFGNRANGLNLVVAAVTLWNTIYLERAAEQFARSQTLELAYLHHASPLGWETSTSPATTPGTTVQPTSASQQAASDLSGSPQLLSPTLNVRNIPSIEVVPN